MSSRSFASEDEGPHRTPFQILFQKICLDPCACLCTGVSDIAAKLSVVASLAAAGAVALAVFEKADLALLFAAISSTGATIAAVLAVCGSVVTGLVDKIMGDDDSDSSAEESGSLVKDASVSRMDEESKMNEEEAREEYKRSLAKGDSKRVSFSD
mmetsp:Transcript_2139/g.2899  ORF Transcript_2139/g.2899 Transcript_2139/m.2899 type:complete len:155 (+) Transcript_2139:119-583(+)|eukprot:CAMPEP_0116065396 /NCGR_PEP_ID=MMETSP0322-20121206/9738_1 /TAXON_ID=163516 /ORGANISM="Leptocylindrus danicus var. apora, Strain B651" /LENGTH=154 /DNA_ID=CAMNT_0003551703 /DNA_START=111 /DNA_END=575 /DNA_ORIENTATION=-